MYNITDIYIMCCFLLFIHVLEVLRNSFRNASILWSIPTLFYKSLVVLSLKRDFNRYDLANR